MIRPYLPIRLRSCLIALAATVPACLVSCSGGDFTLTSDDAGASSSSGGSGASSSGASGGGNSSGSSGAGSSGSGASSSGSGTSSSGGSSSGSVKDSGACPAGKSWCAPCPGIPGRCEFACPAIACAADAGGGPDGTVEAGGPLDAGTNDSSVCPPGQHQCPGCNGPSYCAQVCPAILCVPLDAASDAFQGSSNCNPACANDQTCCAGGAAGSFYCATLDGGSCPLVP